MHVNEAMINNSKGDVDFRDLQELVCLYDAHNFKGARVQVPSALNVREWKRLLVDYDDKIVVEFLEFGWPLNYQDPLPPSGVDYGYNHKSAYIHAKHVTSNIDKDLALGALIGPFTNQPFKQTLVCSPMQIVTKDKSKFRLVIDASFPSGKSVNEGIPTDQFLNESIELKYPSVDNLAQLVRKHGKGCLMYKTDLSNAYKQLPICPKDWPLCGISWKGSF